VKIGGRGWLLIGASAAVVGAIAVGFHVLGTPQEARGRELDRRRIEDLQSVAMDLTAYANGRGGRPLPASLDAIDSLTAPGFARRDPVSRERYEYRRIDDTHFELCATFDSESKATDLEKWEQKWVHPVGHACFAFDVHAADRLNPIR
jgi:hypothetical protein